MTIKQEIQKINKDTERIREITKEISRIGHIETSDISILKRYKKAHNPEELEGSERICLRCGKGKQYRHGRYWTPCQICKNLRKG
jgi:NADH pyrophosphatase NudC (nudix superfamily)